MKLHHIGIAVDSIATHAEHYAKALGITLSTDIIEDERQRVRVAFAPVGPDAFIEFVEPMDAESPISSLLARGGGIYHACYVVADLDDAIARVCRSGGRLVSGPTPARAFQGRSIAWVYTPNRTLVELLEQDQA
jgi:methylmalonyl-CoA/ethylmalonyl-CoA epimerase